MAKRSAAQKAATAKMNAANKAKTAKKKPEAKKPATEKKPAKNVSKVKKTNAEVKADRQAKLIEKHSNKQPNGAIECDLIWVDGVLTHKATGKPAK